MFGKRAVKAGIAFTLLGLVTLFSVIVAKSYLRKLLNIDSGHYMHEIRSKRTVDDRAPDEILTHNKDSVNNIYRDAVRSTTEGGGAMYIRWGRTQCPGENTERVYAGVAGGSWYNHDGGKANPLCLPNDPIWGRYDDTSSNYVTIYGAEYELPSDGLKALFLRTNAEDLDQHNVPCVVCRSLIRSSVFLLPGRNMCYKGWHTEYYGYLMADNDGHKGASEYICMDEAPEADPKGFRDENGKLFFPVAGICGSLPCPPYVNGRELTCSVCSK